MFSGLKLSIRLFVLFITALASLQGDLGMEAAEALPGIIGAIISWILNRVKQVVGWVAQTLWALAVLDDYFICIWSPRSKNNITTLHNII